MRPETARDIMNRNVITASDKMTVQELADLFTEHSISGAPVVDDDSRLVGVVSLTDIVRAGAQRDQLSAAGLESKFYLYGWDDALSDDDMRDMPVLVDDGMLVANVMTPTIFGVPEDISIAEMADTMIRGRIHRLIVMTDDRVAGIVTTLDMLKAIREHFDIDARAEA